jgi:hypothetical protein
MKMSHCVIHDVDESVPEDAWLVCFECGHVYGHVRDLIAEWKETFPKAGEPEYIPFCPLCLHDFWFDGLEDN